MTNELIAIIENREMGRVVRDNRGKVSFTHNHIGATLQTLIHFRIPCHSP